MSKNYSKEDLRQIAEGLIEELRECEDGTCITTWQLLKEAGYDMDEFEFMDLFEIHADLFEEARKNHITLDMSAHDGKVEGLLYNLDYVVHNKRAQIKCPHCGSKNTARYLYGLPAFSEKMQKMLDEGKWALGGCCISTVDIGGQAVPTMPGRRCNDCKKDFGSAPILITPKKDTVEDYRDIVTSIKFSVGGYFGGHTTITITKNEKGALVKVMKMLEPDEDAGDRQITNARWRSILDRLYGQMYLHEWKKNYVDPYVLDGTQWSLELGLTGNRKRNYYGSNDYPPYWTELKKVFRSFAKL